MAKLPITSKGKKWEILNSWWILTAFVFFGFIGFFYIGATAKQKKWKISGAIYLGIWIFSIIIIQSTDLSLTLFALGWVISIVHSLLVRKQYLIRREYIVKNKVGEKEENAKLARMQQEIRKEYEGDSVAVDRLRESIEECVESSEIQPKAIQKVTSALDLMNQSEKIPTEMAIIESDNEVENKLDINNCSVEELASLPGISIVVAKKAEAYRRDHKGFFSVDEFFAVTALKSHFVNQIQDLIICEEMVINNNESERGATENTKLNNKLDVVSDSKEKKGRVLDF